MIFKNKHWVVSGFGVTGQSAVNFLLNKGATISIYDEKDISKWNAEALGKIKGNNNVKIFAGQIFPESLDGANAVLVSPGVHLTEELTTQAKFKKIKIYNDITSFLDLWKYRSPVVGVTGSNGKSTVVTLLDEVLKGVERPSYLAGNIGNSPLNIFGTKFEKENPVIILELSSYMLELFDDKHYVDIAVITNLTNNHLDRYDGSMEGYAEAKSKLANMAHTVTIVDVDDKGTRDYVLPLLKDHKIFPVSLEQEATALGPNALGLGDNSLSIVKDGENLYDFKNITIRNIHGTHNLYNIAFVLVALAYLDVDFSKADPFVRAFKGLEHRIEFVRNIDGVNFINDSKSTSPDATIKALECVANGKNVILLIGGSDKGLSFSLLIDSVIVYVKSAIILPTESLEKIEPIFKETLTPVEYASSLEKAVLLAQEKAENGDVVLLSPSAGSHVEFKNFEERGKVFKEAVNKLQPKE